jgi:hypothetical protein
MPEVLDDLIMDGLDLDIEQVPSSKELSNRAREYWSNDFWGLAVQDASVRAYMDIVLNPSTDPNKSVEGNPLLEPFALARYYETALKMSQGSSNGQGAGLRHRRKYGLSGSRVGIYRPAFHKDTPKRTILIKENPFIKVDYTVEAIRPTYKKVLGKKIIENLSGKLFDEKSWEPAYEFYVRDSQVKYHLNRVAVERKMFEDFMDSINLHPVKPAN